MNSQRLLKLPGIQNKTLTKIFMTKTDEVYETYVGFDTFLSELLLGPQITEILAFLITSTPLLTVGDTLEREKKNHICNVIKIMFSKQL